MALNDTDRIVLLAALALIVVIYFRTHPNHSRSLPPGPRRLPFLGNLFNAPRSLPWLTYAGWSKTYGSDVLHLNIAGKDVVVLNSTMAAQSLLEKRSLIYSSRPRSAMLVELMGMDWVMTRMPYGERWRERRKLFTVHFHPSKAQSLQLVQTELVRKMLPKLLERPDDFLDITRYGIGSIALTLAYGIPIQSEGDPFLALADDALHRIIQVGIPGTYLVDFIPILRYLPGWMPGAGFQRVAEQFRGLNHRLLNMPFEAALQHMVVPVIAKVSDTAKPSFTSQCLEGDEGRPRDEGRIKAIKDTAAIVFGAGADTTIATVHTFLLAAVNYPGVQIKAQEELDRVLRGRLPEFSDQTELPYITAIVKETLRWQPVVPLGLPHSVTEEDMYEGYRIPKGSIVMANIWAMLHDDEAYPEPFAFKPERFLKEDGSLNPDVRNPESVAFGFGRRICPGSHVALSMVWLTVATILTTFSISKARDEDGVEIEAAIEYKTTLVNHPVPFKCAITPRSRESEKLIRAIQV